MAFKIAYCAGHYLGTAGKRIPAYLDKNETREWVLNDRVADHFAKAAEMYEGVELLRTDDPTGNTFIDIPERTAKANAWGADLYLDIHHNAGINGGTGGGVVAYSYPGAKKSAEYRNAIYNAIIAAGGIKGNRSNPLQEVAFDSLALTAMDAVLVEYGFMDSTVDAPIILTDEYSKAVAYATMEGIAKVAGLQKKKQDRFFTLQLRYLDEGCTGEDVEVLQHLLTANGFLVGVDGIFGPKTAKAVGACQKRYGLYPDEVAGPKTMTALLGLQKGGT